MPDNRQALPAQTKKASEHEPPNDGKANESPNTTQTEQTVKSAESIYAIKRKNKRLIADLQSKYQNSRNSERYLSGLADTISTQFHNVIVVPTIEYRRSKNKVVHTSQDINVSIKSTLFENISAAILHTLALERWSGRSVTLCLISAATGFII